MNTIFVSTVKLTGDDIGRLLLKDSEINLFLKIVRDGIYEMSIDIPYLNETVEKEFSHEGQRGEDSNWFEDQSEKLEMNKKLLNQKHKIMTSIELKSLKMKSTLFTHYIKREN